MMLKLLNLRDKIYTRLGQYLLQKVKDRASKNPFKPFKEVLVGGGAKVSGLDMRNMGNPQVTYEGYIRAIWDSQPIEQGNNITNNMICENKVNE